MSTDTWQREGKGGNATSETTMPIETIEWETKEAEATFNTLQSNYNAQVDKIKSEQRVIPAPGPDATAAEQAKYANDVQGAILDTQARIALLGPSSTQQLLSNAENNNGLKKVNTEVGYCLNLGQQRDEERKR